MNLRGNNDKKATFFGGVVPASEDEQELAEHIGNRLAATGFVLQSGGYNGLMEAAARGAATATGEIVAVTLTDVEWGEFNPYVTDVVRVRRMGDRLHRFLDDTDLVVAMGGGVGTLHEISAALWYSGNVRAVPIWLAGSTALELGAFLRAERWLFESPTRSLAFLREVRNAREFDCALADFVELP
ncbi:SLOG cluster 4 domain-containing protein [Nocardia camponoti]|uniref:DNA transporter n=1 Tax=Nocardia camponoti TaxID=1616106 RepID=A0A917QCT0_9NOCA|nr:LOG family protein [Nocardia camponoti]GGK43656.1 hypothetical protein GCM10011591_14100 [Nocardia camponoti]